MSREKEIIEAGIEYTMRTKPNMLAGDKFFEEMREFNRNKAFEEGAKWADEHPNLYNDEKYHTVKVSDLDRLYKKLEVYEKYFDIACAWLEGIDFEFEYQYSEDGYTFFDNEKFINDFRKAMEE
jgi:hypothetical protein